MRIVEMLSGVPHALAHPRAVCAALPGCPSLAVRLPSPRHLLSSGKYEAAHFATKCAAHCTFINCVSEKSGFRILDILVGHGTLRLSLRENVAVLCP